MLSQPQFLLRKRTEQILGRPVLNVIVDSRSRYIAILDRNSPNVDVLDWLKGTNITELEYCQIEDELATAAVCDYPTPMCGFLRSERFAQIAEYDQVIGIKKHESVITYGRVLAYSAHFLSLLSKQPSSTFTRVSCTIPCERLQLSEMLSDNVFSKTNGENANLNSCLVGLTGFIKKLCTSSNIGLIERDISEKFNESMLGVEQIAFGSHIEELVANLSAHRERYLETELTPPQNLKLLFVLYNGMVLKGGTTFMRVLFLSRFALNMYNDIGLATDSEHVVLIFTEYIRKIVLGLDNQKLRDQVKNNNERNKRGYHSRLRRENMLKYHQYVLQENWIDFAHDLALDDRNMESFLGEKSDFSNALYKVFLVAKPTEKNITKHYFIVCLFAFIISAKISAKIYDKNKHHPRKKDGERLKAISELMIEFETFLRLVRAEEDGKPCELTLDKLYHFLNANQRKIGEVVDKMTNDEITKVFIGAAGDTDNRNDDDNDDDDEDRRMDVTV